MELLQAWSSPVSTWAGGGEGPSLAGPEMEAGFHVVSWVYLRSTATTRGKPDLHYHWTETDFRTQPVGPPPYTGAIHFQPQNRRAFWRPENSPSTSTPQQLQHGASQCRQTHWDTQHCCGAHEAAAGQRPAPARPGPRVTAGTRGATAAARPTDRCQLPRSPGARRTGRHEAAGGPRGGNQDHIQRESRLNFQPRVCRGAWSCLVNAAGNTWDTLTALIVPTHSAVDEL